MSASEDKHWHIKREIPVAVIIALVAQGAVIVGGLAKMDSRVEQLELRRDEDKKAVVDYRAEDRARLLEVEKRQTESRELAVRVDEQLKTMRDTLARLENKLTPAMPTRALP